MITQLTLLLSNCWALQRWNEPVIYKTGPISSFKNKARSSSSLRKVQMLPSSLLWAWAFYYLKLKSSHSSFWELKLVEPRAFPLFSKIQTLCPSLRSRAQARSTSSWCRCCISVTLVFFFATWFHILCVLFFSLWQFLSLTLSRSRSRSFSVSVSLTLSLPHLSFFESRILAAEYHLLQAVVRWVEFINISSINSPARNWRIVTWQSRLIQFSWRPISSIIKMKLVSKNSTPIKALNFFGSSAKNKPGRTAVYSDHFALRQL